MKYLAMVRYGAMAYIGQFSTEVVGLRLGDAVIARTDRGVEVGQIVSQCEVLREGADDKDLRLAGEILRRMSSADEEKAKKIEEEDEPTELKFCQKRVQERGLPMKLASVEHLFGGTKVIFYFLADGRVDFRELVKDLAQEYHCRIELRQIGVRDEARLLADYEHCGRPLCCRTFVKKLEPVTMKMAKSQKATLDPAKISGRCGRLMCCLRFEDPVYEEFKRQLPAKGSRVVTSQGTGVVVDQDILRRLVKIEGEQGLEAIVPVSDIQRVETGRPGSNSGGQDAKRRSSSRRNRKPAKGGPASPPGGRETPQD